MEKVGLNITPKEFKQLSKWAEEVYNVAVVVDYFCETQPDKEECYNLAPVAEVKDVLNNNYQAILNWLNIENAGIINAIGIESVEHLKTTPYPTQAYELGKSL